MIVPDVFSFGYFPSYPIIEGEIGKLMKARVKHIAPPIKFVGGNFKDFKQSST